MFNYTNILIQEIYDFQYNISEKNSQYLNILNNKKDNNILDTKENLSIFISQQIVEDLNVILKLTSFNVNQRYIDYIIRGLVEQVIEYKYVLKNNLINEYLGVTLAAENNISENISDIIKQFRNINGHRYLKPNMMEMAKDIGESITQDEDSSLYGIFSIFSEQSHNSYYSEYLSYFDNKQVEKGLTYFQLNMICIIISKFLTTYNNI